MSCHCPGNSFEPVTFGNRPLGPGEQVVLLGYPTGLKALMARTSDAFSDQLKEQQLDVWEVAGALARNDLIQPLASLGIIGQVTENVIAYDADTTRGGSGGPVLNDRGQLVGVVSAIIPEYGSSNLGVPVSLVRKLLDDSYASATEVAMF